MLTHKKLSEMFYRYCNSIGIDKKVACYRTNALGDGSAFVKIDKQGYHYITEERGVMIEHKITIDYKELLYWLLSDIIFTQASKYELENRIETQDFRRILFSKEIELFRKLNEKWALCKEKEIDEILKENPYVDKH